ncbi:topless-related protein 3-like protein, partial [Tanacetum coccineum]
TPVNLPPGAVTKLIAYTSLGGHGQPFPPNAASANANALAGWMANAAAASSSVQASVVSALSLAGPPNQVSFLKRPATPLAPLGMAEYQSPDHEQIMKRLRPAQPVEEVSYESARQQSWSVEDLPRTVAFSIHQGSNVTSMDFHPSNQTLLLVGSINGDITLWDVGSREKRVSKPFNVWDMPTCSLSFQASYGKDAPMSVNRVRWSPDGLFIGVAFNKHLIHVYSYLAPNDLRQRLEVWDLTGRKLSSFEGHEAPVTLYALIRKRTFRYVRIYFIFSTAIDGKIKAWLYDNMGSRVDYAAPGHGCTTMLYSADGSRLFSCGTSKEGDSFLVEWNESEGALKKTYSGFRKKLNGVAHFDTTRNHFLAVGEENQIKFWDMDNVNILTTTEAEGGLPMFPRLRFNKEGNLLAVATADNGIKILANAVGLRSLRTTEAPSFEASKASIEPTANKMASSSAIGNPSSVNCKVERSSPVRPSNFLNGGDSAGPSMEKPRNLDDDKMKPRQLTEILDAAQCRLVTMPDSADASSKGVGEEGRGGFLQVARLLYTNSGVGIVALGSNGIQRLWKWARNEQNPTGKATANVIPQHWQPNSGLLMTNDVMGVNLEEAFPCIALSKNDSYVMSASGGKISLFNMMTFKWKDSTIHIYNVRVDEVKSKLRGHQKRISGLAFSTHLKILVSSAADAHVYGGEIQNERILEGSVGLAAYIILCLEGIDPLLSVLCSDFLCICFWSIDSWEKRKMVQIQLPPGKAPTGDTRVQFHTDQIRLLVSHETQLALYDASKMELIRQWLPQDNLSAPISYASYSCNSQLVYASFCNGNIGVFDADTLKLRCRIAPSVYLPTSVPNGNQAPYPLVVAAHPQEQNQFAVGLTDGSVKVIEPSEAEGKWGLNPSDES